jgi:hypothetical protein
MHLTVERLVAPGSGVVLEVGRNILLEVREEVWDEELLEGRQGGR